MKKILSIAAVSFITTAICALNANASAECNNTIHRQMENCKLSCCNNESAVSSGTKIYDNIIEELLKGCETKYFDNCNSCQNKPQKPSQDFEDSKPGTPNTPENKPDNGQTGSGNNGNQDNNLNGMDENSKIEQEILRLVNNERKANGLSPVTSTNAALNSAADKRAEEQATSFSHTRPDGTKWTTVLSDYGIKYSTAGENVAYGQKSAEEVMKAWMNSSGHRANILNGNFSEIGIGVHYKNGTYYWSQLFIG